MSEAVSTEPSARLWRIGAEENEFVCSYATVLTQFKDQEKSTSFFFFWHTQIMCVTHMKTLCSRLTCLPKAGVFLNHQSPTPSSLGHSWAAASADKSPRRDAKVDGQTQGGSASRQKQRPAGQWQWVAVSRQSPGRGIRSNHSHSGSAKGLIFSGLGVIEEQPAEFVFCFVFAANDRHRRWRFKS